MKEITITLLVGLVLTIGVQPILAQSEGPDSFRKAEKLRQLNRCEDALPHYDAATRADPKNYRYYLQRARCEYRLNRMGSAQISLERAIELGEDNIPASTYYLLGKVYLNQDRNNLDKATQYYRLAAEKETEPTRQLQYRLLLVQSLSSLGQYEEAEIELSSISSEYPENVTAIYYQAQLAAGQGNWDQAITEYEKALRSSELREATPEERAKYYYGLGEAFEAKGQEEDAKRSFEQANYGAYRELVRSKILDNNPTQLYKVAVSYYLVEEYKASDEFIRQVLAEDPEFPSAYILLSRIAQKTNQQSEAIAQLEKAISYESDSTEKARLLMQLADLQANYHNYPAALQATKEAIASDIRSLGSTKLVYVKARSEYEVGKYSDALRSFERLVSMPRIDAKAKARFNFMLGMAAKQAGKPEKARQAFQNASYGPYEPAAQEELSKLSR